MKLAEILTEDRLDEIDYKKALAAGLISAAAISPLSTNTNHPDSQTAEQRQTMQQHHTESLAAGIARRYKIAFEDARKIVQLAKQHAKPDFPRAEDILAVVGIESSFDHTKKSPLKKDPALGLMQVRPGVWGLKKDDLLTIDAQMQKGVDILSKYYDRLGNADAALNAYNIGLTNHNRGMTNPRYVEKFHREKQQQAKIPMLTLKKFVDKEI